MTYSLHTDRLNLRPCEMNDLDALYQLWTEPDVRKFLFDDRQISDKEARSFIETSLTSFAQHGYGIWLFFAQDCDRIVGFSGLLPSPGEAPSLIFGTSPQFWGRGYAKEAASAILRYAFEVLGLEKVVADVDEPNQASVRVLEALGMSRRMIPRDAIVKERPLIDYEIQRKI